MKKIVDYFLSVFIVAALSLAMASPLLAAEKVIVYSPFKDELMGRLGKAFKEETGISLENVIISTGEIYSRLKVERANPQADIWLSVRALYLKNASEEKEGSLIEAYKSPNLKDVLPRYFYGGPYHITGVGMYPLVFFFNPDALAKIKAEPPKNYQDLLDSKWEGKLVMPHPATSGTGFTILTTVIQLYGEEKGWDYIKRLSKNVDQFTKSGRAPHMMVARGEYPVGVGFWDDVYKLAKEGYPIKPIFPDPIYAEPYCMAIVKNAPHMEAAKKFFDFMLTRKAQEILVEFGDYSVRPDVASPPGSPNLKQLNIAKDDYVWAAKNKKAILEKFRELTGK